MSKSLVLNFHKEGDSGLFEKKIIALKAKYKLVSLSALEQMFSQNIALKNICHITFDDGEQSFYNTVFPILQKHSIPVSLFVSPQIITSKTNFWFQEIEGYDKNIIKSILSKHLKISIQNFNSIPYLLFFKCLKFIEIKKIIDLYQLETKCGEKPSKNISLAELKELQCSGLVEIGAHTLNHPILKNEDDATSYYEITESIKSLQLLLGQPVKYFAYPNGRPLLDFGEREINFLEQNNISMAFSTELNHLNLKCNKLSIPRMNFATMGLAPSNPLVSFRLNSGNSWIDITSVGKPTEKAQREKIFTLLNIKK